MYGFYSKYLPEYNLKIIAINTEACNVQNYFLLPNPTGKLRSNNYRFNS
jgi:hypothetical protein